MLYHSKLVLCNETLIDKLERLCNKFKKTFFNLSHKENVSQTISKHISITIEHMYKADVKTLKLKYHKNLLPQAFEKIFNQKSFHKKTRSSSNVVTSFCHSTVIQQS